MRTSKGASDSPRINLAPKDRIVYAARQLWTLDAAGAVVTTMVIPGGITGATSVSPVDGIVVRGGKPRALFVTGAAKDADVYGLVTPTPTHAAMQQQFGGGNTDGYVVMLDLSKGASAADSAAPAPEAPARLSIAREATRGGGKPGKNDVALLAGTVYKLRPDWPRWNTVDAEFRDAKGAMWPSFAYGKAVSGELKWAEAAAIEGTAAVECPNWCQTHGEQNRRVLGELIKDGQAPKLAVTIQSIGPVQTEEIKTTERNQPVTKTLEARPVKFTLKLGEKSVDLTAKCIARQGKAVESSIDRLNITIYFTVKGSQLGLTGALANEDIDARLTCQAHAGEPAPKRGRK